MTNTMMCGLFLPTINQGLYWYHVTNFETEAKLTKCIEGGISWGSASIVLGNRFECSLYAICMPFVLIDKHSTYFTHGFIMVLCR